jgi:hypothetical protein
MADDEKTNWMSCFGWGCLIVVVVSVLGIGGCVAYFYKDGSGANAAADAYLGSVDGGRYEEAFEALGPGFTEDRGLADFVAFEQATRAQMGACGGWRLSGTAINRESGRSVAKLTYQGSCDGGAVEAHFSLEELDGKWVIQDIRYQEPGVTAVPVCAECGAVVPPGANFCAGCGEAVGSGATADADPVGGDEPSE